MSDNKVEPEKDNPQDFQPGHEFDSNSTVPA